MLFGTCSEKLRREVEQAEALLKQREQDSDRYSRVVRYEPPRESWRLNFLRKR